MVVQEVLVLLALLCDDLAHRDAFIEVFVSMASDRVYSEHSRGEPVDVEPEVVVLVNHFHKLCRLEHAQRPLACICSLLFLSYFVLQSNNKMVRSIA